MKKHSKILLFFMLLTIALLSQTYQIGNRSVTFQDPSRSRDIPCRIYYPSLTSGSNVAPAQGVFPLIVFGHGFLMGYDAYLNFVDNLVPQGYIICLPTTEGGIPPSHENFALDLQFVNQEIKTQAQTNSSFFLYQRVSDRSALMGHSMGGGCATVAAAHNNNIKTLVTFAAAETNVSAIAAAANILKPTLIFAGENDGVTPPSEHQLPMYNNLTVDCKGYISIKGGGHCYFANFNLACATGEMTTSPQPTITREQQHQAIFNALIPYLEWQLKGNNSKRQEFENVINNNTVYSSQFTCNATSLESDIPEQSVIITPTVILDYFQVINSSNEEHELFIFSTDGKMVMRGNVKQQSSELINLHAQASGLYYVYLKSSKELTVYKIIKL